MFARTSRRMTSLFIRPVTNPTVTSMICAAICLAGGLGYKSEVSVASTFMFTLKVGLLVTLCGSWNRNRTTAVPACPASLPLGLQGWAKCMIGDSKWPQFTFILTVHIPTNMCFQMTVILPEIYSFQLFLELYDL